MLQKGKAHLRRTALSGDRSYFTCFSELMLCFKDFLFCCSILSEPGDEKTCLRGFWPVWSAQLQMLARSLKFDIEMMYYTA